MKNMNDLIRFARTFSRPAWNSSREGQVMYDASDDSLYLATSTAWQKIQGPAETAAAISAAIAALRDEVRGERVFEPPGFHHVPAAVTTWASGTCYARYLGRAPKAASGLRVRANITTAYIAGTYAEVGVATGTLSLGVGASLTRLGFTSVAGLWNALGRTSVDVNAAISAGDELWLIFGSSGGTQFQATGGGGDAAGQGVTQFLGATRPSTMAAGAGFGVTTSAANDGWFACMYI